jgi:hypothetical protein
VFVRIIPRGRWQVAGATALPFSRSQDSDFPSHPLTAVPVSCIDGWAGLRRSRLRPAWLRLKFTSAAEALIFLGTRLGLVEKAMS